MAQINISFDTKEKSYSVTIDGKKQSNINNVYLYGGGDYEGAEPHIELLKTLTNEDEGMMERTCIYASHTTITKEIILNISDLGDKVGKAMKVFDANK